MWLCSLVQLLAPSLIDDEPRSSMSTSGRTALPPPLRGGLIRPRRVGLYRTGPPPPHRGGLSRPPTRWVGLGCTRPPSRRIGLGLHLPSSSSSVGLGRARLPPLRPVGLGRTHPPPRRRVGLGRTSPPPPPPSSSWPYALSLTPTLCRRILHGVIDPTCRRWVPHIVVGSHVSSLGPTHGCWDSTRRLCGGSVGDWPHHPRILLAAIDFDSLLLGSTHR